MGSILTMVGTDMIQYMNVFNIKTITRKYILKCILLLYLLLFNQSTQFILCNANCVSYSLIPISRHMDETLWFIQSINYGAKLWYRPCSLLTY
jgi:hypothetical protein